MAVDKFIEGNANAPGAAAVEDLDPSLVVNPVALAKIEADKNKAKELKNKRARELKKKRATQAKASMTPMKANWLKAAGGGFGGAAPSGEGGDDGGFVAAGGGGAFAKLGIDIGQLSLHHRERRVACSCREIASLLVLCCCLQSAPVASSMPEGDDGANLGAVDRALASENKARAAQLKWLAAQEAQES